MTVIRAEAVDVLLRLKGTSSQRDSWISRAVRGCTCSRRQAAKEAHKEAQRREALVTRDGINESSQPAPGKVRAHLPVRSGCKGHFSEGGEVTSSV